MNVFNYEIILLFAIKFIISWNYIGREGKRHFVLDNKIKYLISSIFLA